MLANPDINKISMEKYKREILQTFIRYFLLFVTISLNPVYLEVIATIHIISGC